MKKYSFSLRINNSFAYRFNKLTDTLKRPFIINLNNKRFNIPLSKTLGDNNIHLEESWFGNLIKALRLSEDGDFIDIGANEGQTLLTFKSYYNNRYWGFEPNPICISYLEDLIKANDLNDVNILPVGLSSKNSVVKLFSKSSHDSSATILNEFRPGFYTSEEVKYVPVFSFDELELNIRKVALVKIDVEGAELDVVTGMLKTLQNHQPIVICEVLDYAFEESKKFSQNRVNQLVNCFHEMNYKIYRILHGLSKVSLEEISIIELKQWTNASSEFNDYLFLPEHISCPVLSIMSANA